MNVFTFYTSSVESFDLTQNCLTILMFIFFLLISDTVELILPSMSANQSSFSSRCTARSGLHLVHDLPSDVKCLERLL